MGYSILNLNQYNTTKWSGGSTTELFIYPEVAQYSERDFGFRISTATVEVETSTFTPLPGFERNLMVLEGEMTLTHNGETQEALGKFDVDTFDGAWDTKSDGTCTDFNLMTNIEFDGDICGVPLTKNELVQVELEDEVEWLFIYNLKKPISVIIGNKNLVLESGELLKIHEVDFDELSLHSEQDSECVLVMVSRTED
jgi:hypothetical protein